MCIRDRYGTWPSCWGIACPACAIGNCAGAEILFLDVVELLTCFRNTAAPVIAFFISIQPSVLDVVVYARGPWSHLFTGTVEQTHIFDVMYCEWHERHIIKEGLRVQHLAIYR